MIHKRLEDITKDDILALQRNVVRERRDLEYKLTLPGTDADSRKEFLADVSSFANAAGGDLIFGVEAKDGVPVAIPGLTGFDPDGGSLGLEQMIRDGIDPRIPGIRPWAVPGFNNGPALILRIPKSWASPHMVTFKNSSRFFSRSSAGKFQLDVREIGTAFEGAAGLSERIRQWRDDRIGKIVAGETPVLLRDAAKLVFHAIPFESFGNEMRFSPVELSAARRELWPMVARSISSRINLDGFLVFSSSPEAWSYGQAFRSGRIESVMTSLVSERDGGRLIWMENYEAETIKLLRRICGAYSTLGVQPPMILSVAMVGIRGAELASNADVYPFDRDVLVVPEVLLESLDVDAGKVLRPIFNAVCNAGGLPESPNYVDGIYTSRPY